MQHILKYKSTISYIIIFSIISVGRRESCTNEGEIVPVNTINIKDMTCFKCICQVSTFKLTDWTFN